jgi:hypothetical protein
LPADLRSFKAIRCLLGHESSAVVAQCALLGLEGEVVVGLPIHDLPSDDALATHRMGGHDCALDCSKGVWCGDDFIRFFCLSEHKRPTL